MAAPIYKGGLPFFKSGTRQKYKVNASGSATVSLAASQSNECFLFDTNSGVVYTLPAASPGLMFSFCVTVTVTTNTYKVITKNTGTEFLIGELVGYNAASSDASLGFHGDGSSHVAVTQNSSGSNATGGLQGSWIDLYCLSTTLWIVDGSYIANTTATTPFATS